MIELQNVFILGDSCSTYDGPNAHNSFIRRFDRLIENSFFHQNSVDTMFIMGG